MKRKTSVSINSCMCVFILFCNISWIILCFKQLYLWPQLLSEPWVQRQLLPCVSLCVNLIGSYGGCNRPSVLANPGCQLDTSVKGFLDQVMWGGESFPKCGWLHPMSAKQKVVWGKNFEFCLIAWASHQQVHLLCCCCCCCYIPLLRSELRFLEFPLWTGNQWLSRYPLLSYDRLGLLTYQPVDQAATRFSALLV